MKWRPSSPSRLNFLMNFNLVKSESGANMNLHSDPMGFFQVSYCIPPSRKLLFWTLDLWGNVRQLMDVPSRLPAAPSSDDRPPLSRNKGLTWLFSKHKRRRLSNFLRIIQQKMLLRLACMPEQCVTKQRCKTEASSMHKLAHFFAAANKVFPFM